MADNQFQIFQIACCVRSEHRWASQFTALSMTLHALHTTLYFYFNELDMSCIFNGTGHLDKPDYFFSSRNMVTPCPEYRQFILKLLHNYNTDYSNVVKALGVRKANNDARAIAITTPVSDASSLIVATQLSFFLAQRAITGAEYNSDRIITPIDRILCDNNHTTEIAEYFTDDFKQIFQDNFIQSTLKKMQVVAEELKPCAIAGMNLISGVDSTSFSDNILVIDGNTGRPGVHKLFGIQQQPGLAELLAGTESLDHTIHPVAGTIIHILTAGNFPYHPGLRHDAGELSRIVDLLKSKYAFIVIDSGPVLLPDAGFNIAGLADGVVLVLNSGQISWDTARRAKKRLCAARANILGVVLNLNCKFFPGTE